MIYESLDDFRDDVCPKTKLDMEYSRGIRRCTDDCPLPDTSAESFAYSATSAHPVSSCNLYGASHLVLIRQNRGPMPVFTANSLTLDFPRNYTSGTW
ncbi:hypothetical protein K227x_51670 [Rubripirellula lacrimiformis]|uniref:Uncharacterized protein n=1 Tax=Rubripirellula lacrimiformis TaxID=1930273 RepID=A0A517NHZ1_9BACT|nr:hypothetical protein K227x_51670 [Rubripirellula lacrimiformis]